MVIFHSYVKLPEGTKPEKLQPDTAAESAWFYVGVWACSVDRSPRRGWCGMASKKGKLTRAYCDQALILRVWSLEVLRLKPVAGPHTATFATPCFNTSNHSQSGLRLGQAMHWILMGFNGILWDFMAGMNQIRGALSRFLWFLVLLWLARFPVLLQPLALLVPLTCSRAWVTGCVWDNGLHHMV